MGGKPLDHQQVERIYNNICESLQLTLKENEHLRLEVETLRAQAAKADEGELEELRETVAKLEQERDGLLEKLNSIERFVARMQGHDKAPGERKAPPTEAPRAAPRPVDAAPPIPSNQNERPADRTASQPTPTPRPSAPPVAPPADSKPPVAEHVAPRPAMAEPSPAKAPVREAAAPPKPAAPPVRENPAPMASEEPRTAAAKPAPKPEADAQYQADDPFGDDEGTFADNDDFFKSLTSKDDT